MAKDTDRKKLKKNPRNWAKIFGILAIVFIAIVMVVSTLGSSWMSSLVVAKPGDSATIDVTFYDSNGVPLITSNQKIFDDTTAKKATVFLTDPLSIIVNSVSSKTLYPIAVQSSEAGSGQYAITKNEMGLLSNETAGLSEGKSKRIDLQADNFLPEAQMTADAFNKIGGNFTTSRIGDNLFIYIPENAVELANNNTTPAVYYFRMLTVENKTAYQIALRSGLSTADITLKTLNRR